MKVAIFNVKYSPNLGDGVIACCLENALQRRGDIETVSIDLAGRTAWREPKNVGRRVKLLRALQSMPGVLRRLIVGTFLGSEVRRTLLPAWKAQLEGVDAAIIGGGQLLQDGDLNFPIKIAAAQEACNAHRIPFAIHSVGVAQSQSFMGRRMFQRLLTSPRLTYLSVRDTPSLNELSRRGFEAAIGRDPGLLSAKLWPSESRDPEARGRVGLGIAHPAVLAHHGGRKHRETLEAAVMRYRALACRLAESSYDVVCFTNGAGEDEQVLARLSENLTVVPASATEAGGEVTIAPRCETPEQLARLVANCDIVVAHRLHAAILAHAYGRPAFGLRWDSKLESYFLSIGRPSAVLDFDDELIKKVPDLISRSLEEGVDPVIHARTIDETEEAIDDLVMSFRDPVTASVAYS